MSYGAYSFNKIQLGREATAGTAVPATTIWRGPAIDIEDGSEYGFVEEDVGLLLATGNQYQASKLARLAMPETALTYEQVLHILEAGVKTASPNATSPYTYTYTWPTATTLNAIKTYTIETGSALVGDVNEMEYGFVESFTLSGSINEPWMMAANWVGRQKSTSSFTAALSVPTTQEAMFNNTNLYIDDGGGSIGTTQQTGVLVSADINVDTGIQAVFVPTGQLYFYVHKFTRPSITGSFTLELENDNDFVATERAAWAARTLRLIQFSCAGTGSRNLVMQFAANYTSVGTYENQDNDTVVTFEWEARYSSTDSLYGSIAVTNLLAAVP